jgi:hypothetical protein
MSFKNRYNEKIEIEEDSIQKLMCSVAGCNKRWSVHMSGDKPKCSYHQWDCKKPATLRDLAVLLPNEPKIENWYDKI